MSTRPSLSAVRLHGLAAQALRSARLRAAARLAAFALAALSCAAQPASAQEPVSLQMIQQGGKLVGTGAVGAAQQGHAVALSVDGNTAIVSGYQDNSQVGAAWVYVRSGGVWGQQGGKLVGTGAVGAAGQGTAVALSADGNTAVVGGVFDNTNVGAVWVFTRSAGVWTQQGAKLVGTGAVGQSRQGVSAALSADGNTLIVGGSADNSQAGAAWVFTRSVGAWTQQGGKLVGTGATGNAFQGYAVALSADGNTAASGGPFDNTNIGATWFFVRSAGVWSQQGNKLVGSNALGQSFQGAAVALAGTGNTAIVGGPLDASGIGAIWLFARRGGGWSQQGNKLVGTGPAGPANQGTSAALSGDGNTAVTGGGTDNSSTGAAWVFVRTNPTNSHDYDDDGRSDLAWRDGGGNIALWLMNASQVRTSGVVGGIPAGWTIVGQRDFNGDGKHDLLWRDSSGNIAMWFLNGTQIAASSGVGNIPATWTVAGVADFNHDGRGDILWRDGSGNVAVWLMNGATVTSTAGLGNVPSTWTVVGTGDFNGDGKADVLWRDGSGNIAIWFMNGLQVASSGSVGNIPPAWSVVGTGDFNGDGMSDIVWRDNLGNTSVWLMHANAVLQAGALGNVPTTWAVAQTGDYNGDGASDLLWHDAGGNTAIWLMSGTSIISSGTVGTIAVNWTVQSVNAD